MILFSFLGMPAFFIAFRYFQGESFSRSTLKDQLQPLLKGLVVGFITVIIFKLFVSGPENVLSINEIFISHFLYDFFLYLFVGIGLGFLFWRNRFIFFDREGFQFYSSYLIGYYFIINFQNAIQNTNDVKNTFYTLLLFPVLQIFLVFNESILLSKVTGDLRINNIFTYLYFILMVLFLVLLTFFVFFIFMNEVFWALLLLVLFASTTFLIILLNKDILF